MTLDTYPARTRRQVLEVSLRQLAAKSLHDFVQQAWHVLEPSTTFVDGMHIAAVCDHLQAITDGKIIRFLCNIPPGCMKSLLVGVFWPAWEWGPRRLPHLRYLTTSYSDVYAKRDARKMRDLISSEWYQRRWGDVFQLVRSGETSFANNKQGAREAMPFGSLTAGRGDRVIIDDPHSTETAESAMERERTLRIFRESVTTRLNDPKRSAICIIMQRLHAMDVSGEAISQGIYEHLMLPMEFEVDRKCRTSLFEDPREVDGELLFPDRFSANVVERDKIILGPYAVAGQYQQRPSPREGGMFKREWFKVLPSLPHCKRFVRFWDKAGTKNGTGARTAGVLVGEYEDPAVDAGPLKTKFVVVDVVTGRWQAPEREAIIKSTAVADRSIYGYVDIWVEAEPGSGGKESAEGTVANLIGFNCKYEHPTGSKEVRAEHVASQASVGRVLLLAASWNHEFLTEVEMFPVGKLKDVVDGLSGSFNKLCAPGGGLRSPDDFRAAQGGREDVFGGETRIRSSDF